MYMNRLLSAAAMEAPAAACLAALIFSIVSGAQTPAVRGVGRTNLFGWNGLTEFLQAVDSGEEAIATDTETDVAGNFEVTVPTFADGFDINTCFQHLGLGQAGGDFATVVASKGESSYKGKQVVRSAEVAICAIRAKRKTTTRAILVIAAFLDTQDVESLRRAGADYICDATSYDTKSMYHPYYGTDTQGRQDGSMTYYKFLLFNLTRVRELLYFDADVALEEDPSYIFDYMPTDVEMVASREVRYPYSGWNTHMMYVRPNERRFNNIVFRAQTGNYRPFTNTEQDVLENEYAPDLRGFGEPGIPPQPSNVHGFKYESSSERKIFCPDDS